MRSLTSLVISLLLAATPAVVKDAARSPLPDDYSYGLTFRAHTYNQDERTCLDLTPDRALRLQDGFTMEFDLCLYQAGMTYGYVFRIITEDDSCLDMTAHLNTGNLNFILSRDRRLIANQNFHGDTLLHSDTWIHVKIACQERNILCSAAGKTAIIPSPLTGMDKVRIAFGVNHYARYPVTDVPPMTIRNISIEGKTGTKLFFRLRENNETYLRDELSGWRANVSNGIWEIDRHVMWTSHWEHDFAGGDHPQLAWEPETEGLWFANADSVICYYPASNACLSEEVASGRPWLAGGTQLISYKGELYSYSILDSQMRHFDRASRTWSGFGTEYLPPIQHHMRYVDRQNGRLYLFGGYGNHLYHADFYEHGLPDGSWTVKDLSGSIEPRYLGAYCGDGNGHLLVLGGYGNPSGRQEEFPYHFYDLSEINLEDGSARRLFQFNPGRDQLAFAGTMILDRRDSVLYALAYDSMQFNTSLQLMGLNLHNGECTFYGEPIPYRFFDLESCAGLVTDKNCNNLYAIISNARQDGKYHLSLMQLAFPPLREDQIRQPEEESSLTTWIIVCVALLTLAAAGYMAWKRSRRQEEGAPEALPEVPVYYAPNQPCSVSLLGKLQVCDRDGKDITAELSPTVRQLLVLILLNSAETSGKGILSEDLDEALWFGMEKKQAANNRNVNMRRLRTKLDACNISIVINNGYWYAELGEGARCDYIEMMHVLKLLGETPADRKLLDRAVSLAFKGSLLPDSTYPWTDSYKSVYTNAVIEALGESAKFFPGDDDIQFLAARAILVHDSLDEQAFATYCRTLFKKGHKGLAKREYERYIADYRKMLDSEPDFTYESIIKQ